MIALSIINARFGESLPASSENDSDIRFDIHRLTRVRQPLRVKDAISINKLHETNIRVIEDQPPITGIARARGGEWNAHVEIDHHEAVLASMLATAVAGTRVYINAGNIRREGRYACDKALPFVAADNDYSDITHCGHEKDIHVGGAPPPSPKHMRAGL